MTEPVSVSREIAAPVDTVWVLVTDLPRMGEWSPENWCDWVYEVEPTATGCRVTHSWIDHRSGLTTKLGKVVSGVADRASHNRRNMEVTLDNLVRAVEK